MRPSQARSARRPPPVPMRAASLLGGSARVLRLRTRQLCTAARTDGFNEALPRRDVIAPLICAGVYAFSWWAADEGRVQSLAEKVDVNTDPSQNPTPNQVFHHLWPYAAGTLGMLFESVACKFSQTKDFGWLCTKALNDDTNAAIALSLITPPAEFSNAFLRAICEQPGALQRIKDIVQIYKTLPREQHDDVVVNACVIAAKVAAVPELKTSGLGMADFVWMMPEGKTTLYAQYGLEGAAALWKDDPLTLLASGGILRTHELADGMPLRPSKPESSMVIQLLANRLLGKFLTKREKLVELAVATEKRLAAQLAAAGPVRQKTVWQRAGVHRGETELEVNARMRSSELQAVRATIELLSYYQPRATLGQIETYTSALCAASAALLGALYGGARGYFRGWQQDVTPSVCRELAAHTSKRAALGAVLLVGLFEAAPWLKTRCLELAGKEEVTSYSQPGALEQLVAIDCAYIAAIGIVNFAFPFALVPWACNLAQVLILPTDPAAAAEKAAENS